MEKNLSVQLQQPLWATLAERSQRDDVFRQKLLNQPREVLSGVLGESIPPSVKVTAHEDTPTNMNVVIDPSALPLLDQLPDGGGPIGRALKRAHEDPSFRKALQQNPRQTVLDATGIEIPEGMHVNFFENSPNEVHLSVPAKVSAAGELSDAELEAVAGGRSRRGQRNVCVGAMITGSVGCAVVGIFTAGIGAAISIPVASGAGTISKSV